MLRRQGIWNKQVHDFTTSTRGTKQTRSDGKPGRWLQQIVLQGREVDRRSCGHLNRKKRTSTEQTGTCTTCITSHPLPATQPDAHGYLRTELGAGRAEKRRCHSRRVSSGCFGFLRPCGGETRCYGGEPSFQNGAYRLYFSPLMRVPSGPHLCDPLPTPTHTHLFISITPAITGEERMEREAALLCFSALTLRFGGGGGKKSATQQRWV